MVGNWFFSATSSIFYLSLGWFITDRVVEPRLGAWTPPKDHPPRDLPLGAGEVSGLRWAGIAVLAVIALWAAMTLLPGAPLMDTTAAPAQRLTPFFRSLPAGFFLLFFASGLAFGVRTGVIKRDHDIARFCAQGIASMAPYVVLAFVAAHFIAMFSWSNLGAILAINGAQGLKATGLPAPLLMVGVLLITAFVELFIGSASAKWAAMAPVLVPMMMLLGISPEMTTAAFRAGDSAMNMGTPLMVYFPIALAYAQRWRPQLGVGGLLACTLPYSAAFLCSGVLITGVWTALHLPPDSFPADDPARIDRMNNLVRIVAATRPWMVVVDMAAAVERLPGGEFDADYRPDGVHFTMTTAERFIRDWLADQLTQALARGRAASG
jgi:aminobenzoyl-glutamate transport protein